MEWQKKMTALATVILPAGAVVGVSALALHRFLHLQPVLSDLEQELKDWNPHLTEISRST
jgi:hypothetical protein